MSPPLIFFSRHGETDWNVARRFQGQLDVDINDNGRRQADRNGDCLSRLIAETQAFDFVASPLRRASETMERIRVRLGLDAAGFRTDPLLMEVNYGDWEGFRVEEIAARNPGLDAERAAGKWAFVPPGEAAESYAMLADRMRRWLETVSGPTLCVTHGGNIRTLFHIYAGLSGDEAAALVIPQDQVLELKDGALDWH